MAPCLGVLFLFKLAKSPMLWGIFLSYIGLQIG